jgi:hypothetical protein
MPTIPGPYWIRHAASGEIQVCGRYGKILSRYAASEEKVAVADVRSLNWPRGSARAQSPSKQDLARQICALLGQEQTDGRIAELVKRNTAASMTATIARLRLRAAATA